MEIKLCILSQSISKKMPTVVQDRNRPRFYEEVLVEHRGILDLFKKMGFNTKKRKEKGVYEKKMMFRGGKGQPNF